MTSTTQTRSHDTATIPAPMPDAGSRLDRAPAWAGPTGWSATVGPFVALAIALALWVAAVTEVAVPLGDALARLRMPPAAAPAGPACEVACSPAQRPAVKPLAVRAQRT